MSKEHVCLEGRVFCHISRGKGYEKKVGESESG